MKTKSITFTIISILFLIVCYFPIFHHLEMLPLQIYDEARLGVTAIEMLENGNYLIPYFDGKPDMWSTKPPLMIWLQVLGMKVFGVGELAVRLPAAIAALLTVFMLIFFCKKYLQNLTLGLIASLVLITSKGYITVHVTRTGDYDSLLTLFLTAAFLSFFLFIEASTSQLKKKYLFFTALFLVLAIYTKSIVGLMFLPALLLYVLIRGKLITLLKFKPFYLYFAVSLFFGLGYFVLRDYYNPGYINAVFENDLGGRFMKTVSTHRGPFLYYLYRIFDYKFVPWAFLLPIGFLIGIKKEDKNRHFIFLLMLIICSFLLIISSARTKLIWYDAPIYPAMSLLVSYPLLAFLTYIKEIIKYDILVILLIFAYPYKKIIDQIYMPKPRIEQNEYGLFMRKIDANQKYTIAQIGYNAQISFYYKMYKKLGYDISRNYPKNFKVGEYVLVCQKNSKEMIDDLFDFEVLKQSRGCRLIKIIERKE